LDGRPLELRRVKERTLLAMLLLRVNQVVSLDHLAAGLWEDSETPRPPATLRVHVSRLRQALSADGPAIDPVLITSGRGYSLQVPFESVDAWHFERLAADGRRQLAADDPTGAAEAFSQALALWRGRLLDDLTLSPAVEPDVARLEEARLSVIEDKVEAELGCGNHNGLVGELEQLVTEYPLRERLWGQRMVALYRCGRQAESLRAYDELRVLLRDELGIPPSPLVQELNQAILNQDPSLDLPLPIQVKAVGATTTPEQPFPGGDDGSFAVVIGAGEGSGLSQSNLRFPSRLVLQSLLPFSGREPQFASLLQACKETAAEGRRVVLVSGEAGIGKTRLAAEVARRAHDMGVAVLFGRCDEDMGVPFQPFVEALSQVVSSSPTAESLGRHGGELVRLVPELARIVPGLEPPLRADPETERYRLFDAVASWLGAISAETGLLLVLDDLHWAEKPTLLLLRHLVRSAEPMHMLVVCNYRDTELDRAHPLAEMLADLRAEPCVERLALTGLDVGGVLELLTNASGQPGDAPTAELAQLLWTETNGNPFFVQEILRNLVESGRLVEHDGKWIAAQKISDLAIPEGVREVIGRRLNRLTKATNEILTTAAVIGAVIDFDVLVAVSDSSEDAVLDALDEATAVSLLRETLSGSYEFTNAIIRSTLYDELSVARRSRRHRQIAEFLESRGKKDEDAAALAYYFRRAGVAEIRAVDYAAAAGEQALERLAFDQAVAFFSQALDAAEAVDAGPDRRGQLLVRLGTAQRLASVPAHRETLLEAARLARSLGDAELLAQAALANSRGIASIAGVLDEERVDVIEAALDAIEDDDSATRARLLSLLAVELMWGDPELRRLELIDEAIAMARRIHDDVCLLDVWMVAYVAGSVVDRIPGLVADLPAFLELAERVGDAQKLFLIYGLGARHCMEMGDLEQTDSLLERIGRLTAEVNSPFFRWLEANYRCCRLTVTGTGDEIEQAALHAFQIGQDAGQLDSMVWFAAQLFVARWSQGRLAEVADAIRQLADTGGILAWRAASALTFAQVGDRAEAGSIIDDLMAGPADAFPPDVAWLAAHSVLAEAVATAGTAEQAAAEYRLLLPYSGRVPCLGNITRPSITLALAMLATRAGWNGEAERDFNDAHDQHLQLGAGVWLARTQFEWARFLLDVGETDRADVLLSQALEGAARVGAADVTAAIRVLKGETPDRRQPGAPDA
jgi:DNA-binding SARP family transcriptional activator